MYDRNRTRLTYPDSTYITYDYDQLNRLTAVRNSSGTALASYTYDSRSRRTGLEYVNGASIDYSYRCYLCYLGYLGLSGAIWGQGYLSGDSILNSPTK